jgi:hypothetical protein
VVAQRPGGSPAWQALADTLQAPGLTLAALAARHDARTLDHAAALAQHEARLAALEAQLPALRAALQLATAEAAARSAELAAVYTTRSWRITAPLRWLTARLQGRSAPAQQPKHKHKPEDPQ